MTIDLVKDIRTVTELKRDPKSVLEHARRTRRPVVITVNGKADSVVMDVETYQHSIASLNLAKLLAEAEEDVRAGRVRPAAAVFSELRKRAEKIQRGAERLG